MSEYKVEFWSDNRLSELWEIVEQLTIFVAPGIMITVAFFVVGFVLITVVKSFKQASNGKDNDDDFDIKHY